MFETYEIVILLICFLGSAFYSGAEAILMSIGPNRAHQIIEEGGKRAKAINFMTTNSNEILTTILIGNNIVNICAASLTTTITARFFKNDAVAISVGITTFIILIFGEIIPKTFARTHAEKLSFAVVRILQFNYYLLYPIIEVMTWFIESVLGKNAHIRGRLVTKNDLEFMINKAEKENTMDSKQLELLNSILEFPTIKVKDIMIPRSQVKFLQKDATFCELIVETRENGHSRYPVCKDDLDHVVGFLHIKDLAFLNDTQKNNEKFSIQEYLKPPFFVYEHMRIQAVFDHMNRKKVHLALVKDETGMVVGVITLEDIIEEIFGEIQDEHDETEKEVIEHYKKQDLTEGITLESSITLRDLYTEFDIKIPLNDNFSTLSGFLLDMLGNTFPEKGQIIVWEGFSFSITEIKNQEIKTVKITDVDGEKHLFSKSEAKDSDINGNSGSNN